jgi:hypothetical protein
MGKLLETLRVPADALLGLRDTLAFLTFNSGTPVPLSVNSEIRSLQGASIGDVAEVSDGVPQ